MAGGDKQKTPLASETGFLSSGTMVILPTVGWVWMSMVTIDGSLTVKRGESQPGQLRPTMSGFWISGAAAGAMVLDPLLGEVVKATRIVTRRLA